MHAFDLFVDTGEPLRDIPLDIGCERRQAELDPGRQPRVGAEGRDRVRRQWRLVRRMCCRAETDEAERGKAGQARAPESVLVALNA